MPDIEQFDRRRENEVRLADKQEEEWDKWYNNLLDKDKIKLINDIWDNATFTEKEDIFERKEV